jgi:hypothetical protein
LFVGIEYGEAADWRLEVSFGKVSTLIESIVLLFAAQIFI